MESRISQQSSRSNFFIFSPTNPKLYPPSQQSYSLSSSSFTTPSIIPVTACPSSIVLALSAVTTGRPVCASISFRALPATVPPLLCHSAVFFQPLRVLSLGEFCCGSFRQHIQRQLQRTHIIAQIFLFQPFQVLVLPRVQPDHAFVTSSVKMAYPPAPLAPVCAPRIGQLPCGRGWFAGAG